MIRLMKFVSDFSGVGLGQGSSGGLFGSPHWVSESAPLGGLNTTMSPRWKLVKCLETRSTSTRCPIASVGSIDPLGMRYGLTMKAWIPSASPSATAMIVTNSIAEPVALFLCLLCATGRLGTRPGHQDSSAALSSAVG